MSLRLLFAGTPDFSLPALEAAHAHGSLSAVLTQPDRRAGRGRKPQPGPIKRRALELGLEVLQPISLRTPEIQQTLRELQPDLLIVVAYGLILPQAVLDIPRFGAWNLHASLLPRWRGAAPIQRAIEAGDAETGVCLMQMEQGLDTGPVIDRITTPIEPDETGGSLHDRLSRLGAQLLDAHLPRLLASGQRPPAEAQDSSRASYAHKLEKSEALLDWQRPAEALARKVRAFSPWPVAETRLFNERLRIHRAIAIPGSGAAGSCLAASAQGIDIACGSGALRLLEVQRDGGRSVQAADYLNAHPELRQ